MPMSNEFDAQQSSSHVSVIFLNSLPYQRDDTEYPGLCSDRCNRASGTPSNLDLGIKDHRRRKGEDPLESLEIYAQWLATQLSAQLAAN